jgi:hypothetical protein
MTKSIFIPSLSLAFEYQGEQHYHSVVMYGSLQRRKALDEEKKKICNSIGISLIEIPYWWDGSVDSLLATIHHFRPDCVADTKSSRIPTQVPTARHYKTSLRPVHKAPAKLNFNKHWVYGSIPGMRALWKGNGELITEHNFKIQLPDALGSKLPSTPLELYIW